MRNRSRAPPKYTRLDPSPDCILEVNCILSEYCHDISIATFSGMAKKGHEIDRIGANGDILK
jgi:hypothetical protein